MRDLSETLAQKEQEVASAATAAKRSCSRDDTCVFARGIADGGDPCCRCRNLTIADYFTEQEA